MMPKERKNKKKLVVICMHSHTMHLKYEEYTSNTTKTYIFPNQDLISKPCTVEDLTAK